MGVLFVQLLPNFDGAYFYMVALSPRSETAPEKKHFGNQHAFLLLQKTHQATTYFPYYMAAHYSTSTYQNRVKLSHCNKSHGHCQERSPRL